MCHCHGNMIKYKQAFKISFLYLQKERKGAHAGRLDSRDWWKWGQKMQIRVFFYYSSSAPLRILKQLKIVVFHHEHPKLDQNHF